MDKEIPLFDLHQHTTFSDGDMHPKVMAEHIKNYEDRRIMTVTDHDSLEWHKIHRAYMTGIEISCTIEINGKTVPVDLLYYGFEIEKMEKIIEKFSYDWFPTVQDIDGWTRKQRRGRNGTKLILAHPYYCRHYDTSINAYLGACLRHVDGLECFHSSARTEGSVLNLLKACEAHNKIASGGSDNHSAMPESVPWIEMRNKYKSLFNWILNMKDMGY